jgi:hypothetical protein
MFLLNVRHAKIVNHKAKGDRTDLVGEYARGVGLLNGAMLPEVKCEVVVGEDASLGEAVQAFVDFTVDESIDNVEIQSIVFEDGGQDPYQREANVFRACHGSVDTEFFTVLGHKFGSFHS